MRKAAKAFKAPDIKADRKLLHKDLEKYLEELKAGTIGADSDLSKDANFQAMFVDYHSEVLGSLVKLAKILAAGKAR